MKHNPQAPRRQELKAADCEQQQHDDSEKTSPGKSSLAKCPLKVQYSDEEASEASEAYNEDDEDEEDEDNGFLGRGDDNDGSQFWKDLAPIDKIC